jgi:dCMP deaminase
MQPHSPSRGARPVARNRPGNGCSLKLLISENGGAGRRNAPAEPPGVMKRSARPGWDEYFMEIARTVATRATCPRASVGAVVVREHRILTTGYNGAPRRVAHCSEVGCAMIGGHCLRSTHAEANAIVQGALHGVSLAGATMYCTHQPCVNCSKLLISAGVGRVVYQQPYPDALATALLGEAGVAVVHFETLELRVAEGAI